jgi:molecular chaperone HtpG
MTVETYKETLPFQAEVGQVLNLVIRSLYSNKEIFLRELISNASDAAEKLRFEALTDDGLFEGEPNLWIRVQTDKDAGTITVSDNGIGMSRQEISALIGTIANSGTRSFLEKMSGDQARDSQLIGQFGVGFYSAFIIADRVTVRTRRAGLGAEHGVRWESEGAVGYTLETIEKSTRGTDVILHLKEDEKEFLDSWRLRSIITKFSDNIAVPVEMLKEHYGEDKDKQPVEWERVNTGTALWLRNKTEITDDEYKQFYKHISHDFEEPLIWAHNRVEGNNEYNALLYIPSKAPWDLWDREQKHGVKLYVRRMFIMDEAEKLMPRYLRFVKGIVDSNDLPLNVSREILQHNKKLSNIRSANVKRILSLLEELAKDNIDKYKAFWKEFGRVIKEGPGEDFSNRERIASLLRFATSASTDDEQNTSLDEYISRMVEGQETIYYMTADSPSAARYSPHLEIFRKKGIEVLLLSDRVDEWLMTHLTEYKSKHFHSVSKGALDLGKLADKSEQTKVEEAEKTHKDLLEKVKKTLGAKIKDVRASLRLTDSPSCLVVEEHDMSANLARVLKSVGQDSNREFKPILELNLNHPLLRRLNTETDDTRFADLSHILFDQAMLAEGGALDDPGSFVSKLNNLMLNMMLRGG